MSELSSDEQSLLQKNITADELAEFLKYGNDNAPNPPDKYDLWTFFREVLALGEDDSEFKHAKTGNLNDHELGLFPHSVRRYLGLASYADSEDLDLVACYLREKAALITSSSLSRKGFLINTAVTQKRVSRSLGATRTITKRGLFGDTTEVVGGEEDEDIGER